LLFLIFYYKYLKSTIISITYFDIGNKTLDKKKVDDKEFEIIRCPFCGYQGIETQPGKSVCTECGTAFEIDDRGECVFVDPKNLRLPIDGLFARDVVLCRGKRLKIVSIVGVL
jgi:DNA-directed RNA polymerase subunit RPC12/RpoP